MQTNWLLSITAPTICNVLFDDKGWQQVTLSIHHGDIWLTAASDVALPAFASSRYASNTLVNQILQNLTESRPTSEFDDIDESWSSACYDVIPANFRSAQRHWSSVIYKANLESIKSDLEGKRLTHVVAVAQAHNSDWISAIPIAQMGTKLNDDEFRISVALRFGLVVCHPHRCRCGSSVLPDGLHPSA